MMKSTNFPHDSFIIIHVTYDIANNRACNLSLDLFDFQFMREKEEKNHTNSGHYNMYL